MQLKVNIFIGSNSLGVEIARRVRKTTYGRISLSFRSLWCCAMLEVYLTTVQLRCVQRPSSSFKCHEGCKETIGDWTEIQSNQLTSKWNLRVTRSVAGSNSNPPSSTQKETHTHKGTSIATVETMVKRENVRKIIYTRCRHVFWPLERSWLTSTAAVWRTSAGSYNCFPIGTIETEGFGCVKKNI